MHLPIQIHNNCITEYRLYDACQLTYICSDYPSTARNKPALLRTPTIQSHEITASNGRTIETK